MGRGESRRAAGRSGGAQGDRCGDYDVWADENEPRPTWEAGRRLSLVRPPDLEFFLITPRDFDDAQRIADRLRAGDPVVVDLRCCGRELAKRLVDFCSGLVYACEGDLQYVGEKVMLLAPPEVELSSVVGGLQGRRFFNQD